MSMLPFMAGRPREFDRDEALEKAMQLFWSGGYEATGMASLCREMELGSQSVYNCFGDKESLFADALERYGRTRLQPIVERLRAPGSALENIGAVLDMWSEAAMSQSKGCLMANSIAEIGMREPRLSKALGRMLGRMEDAFYEALQRAADVGELPSNRDPRTLARFITTLGQGLATVVKIDPSGSLARDAIESARILLASD